MALLYRMGTGNGSGGDLKPYIVQFTCDSGYIGQTLTMTYKGTPHAGEVVEDVSGTVVLDSTDGKGKLTLYPMHSGNWECSCYSSVTGTTKKKTIELSYWGTTNVSFEDTPNGATVTPTDDIQTWLHCANIWDKSYTTVIEVIADKTTLNALVQNKNANDYLVRSTTFSTKLCENNTNNEAMYYLGLYDSCADNLLADEHWRNAICSADVLLADGQTHLFEKVLNVKVPRMTSNTAPSGEASASSVQSGYPAWKAFNKDAITVQGWTSTSPTDAWIAYDFGKEVKVNAIDIVPYRQLNNNQLRVKDFILQGYNGNGWKDIYNDTFPNDSVNKLFSFINNMSCTIYRLYVKNNYATNNGSIIINELQFYGRVSL